MAYDGVVTMAIAKELNDNILLGKIDKIYQPEKDELVLIVHTKNGNYKLLLSANSNASRVHFVSDTPKNPANPPTFCMLMRKHLQGSRIVGIEQKDSERIIELTFEALNELGFTVSKKLICEIMGKHSNIVLTDIESGKIIDSIKRISIDQSRARQLLPGQEYCYPPKQDKVPFKEFAKNGLNESEAEECSPKYFLGKIGGISLSIAQELCNSPDPQGKMNEIIDAIMSGKSIPTIYFDENHIPKEFHVVPLSDYEKLYEKKTYETAGHCLEYFYDNRESSNRIKQKSADLTKDVANLLNKLYTKKQRLLEDLDKAQNSEHLKLYGELLTANLHAFKTGDKSVVLDNYYDNSKVEIPLDERFSPSKNAQNYFKKYSKARTAIKEKAIQLEETSKEIDYLESVLAFLEDSHSFDNLDIIREELIETGYLKRKKIKGKIQKSKQKPLEYTLSNGMKVLVGRNNKENDVLTLKTAAKTDLWFHTKDIPGSHVILKMENAKVEDLTEDDIYEAASIAAFHSKGQHSSNVPVDYVPVRYVKKPAGAKPGMVIFTHNKTVWVEPKVPQRDQEQ